jgi:D-alanine-D-alanine ligase
MTIFTSEEHAKILTHCGRVGVLMGGNSAERDISLESGANVMSAMQRAGIESVPFDWDGSLDNIQEWKSCDRFFIAAHGRGGEDGKLQSVLEIMDIPYTGTKVLGCALCMDKNLTKRAWRGANLLTPDSMLVTGSTNAEQLVDRLGLPLMIKPAREGSSFGITKADSINEVMPAIRLALTYDKIVLAEVYVAGSEYTIAVLNETSLPVIKIETPQPFFNYDAKYFGNDTRYFCPSELTETAEAELKKIALDAFSSINGFGWGRVDVMLDVEGHPWLIEANAVPGLTSHSLVPMAANNMGISFDELIIMILGTSMTKGQFG